MDPREIEQNRKAWEPYQYRPWSWVSPDNDDLSDLSGLRWDTPEPIGIRPMVPPDQFMRHYLKLANELWGKAGMRAMLAQNPEWADVINEQKEFVR